TPRGFAWGPTLAKALPSCTKASSTSMPVPPGPAWWKAAFPPGCSSARARTWAAAARPWAPCPVAAISSSRWVKAASTVPTPVSAFRWATAAPWKPVSTSPPASRSRCWMNTTTRSASSRRGSWPISRICCSAATRRPVPSSARPTRAPSRSTRCCTHTTEPDSHPGRGADVLRPARSAQQALHRSGCSHHAEGGRDHGHRTETAGTVPLDPFPDKALLLAYRAIRLGVAQLLQGIDAVHAEAALALGAEKIVVAAQQGAGLGRQRIVDRLRQVGHADLGGVYLATGAAGGDDGNALAPAPGDQRHLGRHAVDAVHHAVDVRGDVLGQGVRGDKAHDRSHLGGRLDGADAFGHRLDLEPSYVARHGRQLPAGIGDADVIHVDQSDAADAGARQRLGRPAADTADTDHGHMTALQPGQGFGAIESRYTAEAGIICRHANLAILKRHSIPQVTARPAPLLNKSPAPAKPTPVWAGPAYHRLIHRLIHLNCVQAGMPAARRYGTIAGRIRGPACPPDPVRRARPEPACIRATVTRGAMICRRWHAPVQRSGPISSGLQTGRAHWTSVSLPPCWRCIRPCRRSSTASAAGPCPRVTGAHRCPAAPTTSTPWRTCWERATTARYPQATVWSVWTWAPGPI